jgi:AcrR family transcriptional regulator
MSQASASPRSARGSLADESKREIWDLRWIREPQQDRSARTRAQLLDATERVIENEGIEALTIARVARAAGCSVGSLYHHFQDKQTIIYAVLERMAHETALTAEQGLEPHRWEGVSLKGVLEGYLRYSLKWYRRRPGLIHAQRILALKDPNIELRLNASNRKTRRLILQLLRPRLSEVTHPDPNGAIQVTLATLHAALNQRALSFLPGARTDAPKLSDEAFIREMLKMTAAYLGLAN